MTDLPRDVRKVLNARVDDAILDLYSAVKRDDWLDIEMACHDLVDVLREEIELKREAATA